MMNLFVPLSWTGSDGAIQTAEVRVAACCSEKPEVLDGQETKAVFVCVRRMVSNGAPGV